MYVIMGKNARPLTEKPVITFGSGGVIYLNTFAMRNYFEGAKWVVLLYDKDKDSLAIKAVDKEGESTFRLNFSSLKSKSTGVIAARSVIKSLKIDYSKTRHLTAAWNTKEKMLEVKIG